MYSCSSIRVVVGVVVLAMLPLLPLRAQESSEKETAMEQITSLMDEGDWKKAAKAIKKYGKKYAKTDEEKVEVAQLMATAEGNPTLEKISKEYRKNQKHLTAAKKLRKFLVKYYEEEDLRERAEQLLEAARSSYVLVLEDFEPVEDGPDGGEMRDDTFTDDRKHVKHGLWARRFKSRSWSTICYFNSPEPDLTKYAFYCMWIYNAEKAKNMPHLRIDAMSGGSSYFSYFLAIDWVGWREIRMPLHGKRSLFGRHRNPDWAAIETFRIWHEDEGAAPLDIIIDDIRLEKPAK